jgi:hypothetical protein
MLNHQTIEGLYALKLPAMAAALTERVGDQRNSRSAIIESRVSRSTNFAVETGLGAPPWVGRLAITSFGG